MHLGQHATFAAFTVRINCHRLRMWPRRQLRTLEDGPHALGALDKCNDQD
jgi:hypothetical protein